MVAKVSMIFSQLSKNMRLVYQLLSTGFAIWIVLVFVNHLDSLVGKMLFAFLLYWAVFVALVLLHLMVVKVFNKKAKDQH